MFAQQLKMLQIDLFSEYSWFSSGWMEMQCWQQVGKPAMLIIKHGS